MGKTSLYELRSADMLVRKSKHSCQGEDYDISRGKADLILA